MNDATEVTNWIVQYQATELSDDTEEKKSKKRRGKKGVVNKNLECIKTDAFSTMFLLFWIYNRGFDSNGVCSYD